MEEAILNFKNQLVWEPKVENLEVELPSGSSTSKFIVAGMGGSHLAAGLLKIAEPKLDLLIHRDFGLPRGSDYFLREGLLVASSYSGETEETIDFFQTALAQGLKTAAVTTGGRLLELAKSRGRPYIQLPTDGKTHPRLAVGYSLKALTKLAGISLPATSDVGATLTSDVAGDLAKKLKNKIPLLYAEAIFYPLTYAWKVNLNETSKVPAFANALPEAGHNEIAARLNQNFIAVFLRDSESEDPRIARRFAAVEELYRQQGASVETVNLTGQNIWEKILNNFLLGASASVELAKLNGEDPEANPTIAEFKKRITAPETERGDRS